MAKAVHHVTVVARDARQLISFLTDLLGLQIGNTQNVPAGSRGPLLEGRGITDITSTLMGSASYGLVEVLDLSPQRASPGGPTEPSASLPAPGILSLSFAVPDVAAVVVAARERGYDEVAGPTTLRFGGQEISVAVVRVSGIVIQLSQALDLALPLASDRK